MSIGASAGGKLGGELGGNMVAEETPYKDSWKRIGVEGAASLLNQLFAYKAQREQERRNAAEMAAYGGGSAALQGAGNQQNAFSELMSSYGGMV